MVSQRKKVKEDKVKQTIEKKVWGKKLDKCKREFNEVKFPKFITSKLKGANLDWLDFGTNMKCKGDQTNKKTASKFSYLNELVIQRSEVCLIIFHLTKKDRIEQKQF